MLWLIEKDFSKEESEEGRVFPSTFKVLVVAIAFNFTTSNLLPGLEDGEVEFTWAGIEGRRGGGVLSIE